MNGSHVAADGEVAEGDAREHVGGTVPLAAGDDAEEDVDAVQVVAAAEEVIKQVELADDVEQVEQLGGGVEHDEVVASTIAAQQRLHQTPRTTHRHALLTRVETCTTAPVTPTAEQTSQNYAIAISKTRHSPATVITANMNRTSQVVYNWRYVALVVVLWCPALLSSSSSSAAASVTALR